MSERGTQILKEALSLPPNERAALVEHLLTSLDASARQHIDTLWAQEAEDRLDGFEHGEIATIPAQNVFDAIRKQALCWMLSLSRPSSSRVRRSRRVLQCTA